MDSRTSDYEYDLPQELIAQQPLEERAASRLLMLERDTGGVSHGRFPDILGLVRPGDLWVFNNTRVFPARVFALKQTGAKIELLFLHRRDAYENLWAALARPGKRLHAGDVLTLPGMDCAFCRVAEKHDEGEITVELVAGGSLFDTLARHGETPLPPYIRSPLADGSRYQTLYAKEPGSSAAPTAGLHFSEELLERLRVSVCTAFITLHIGMDTFKPISEENLDRHKMHTEFVHIPKETIDAIFETRKNGGRIVAVGTTSVRSLETFAAAGSPHSSPSGFSAHTNLFIRPGHRFILVDALLTNFHLPRSTLLVLVSAFAGKDHVFFAYHEAIRLKYRFYSLGDAMFIY